MTTKVISEQTRAKLSAIHKGKPKSDEHRKKIGDIHRGKIVSEESREKNRLSHIGRTNTKESKEKTSAKLKGRVFTDEHRRNLSKSLKGRVFTDEWKENISKGWKPNSRVFNTGIELKVRDLLIAIGVNFVQQKRITGVYGCMDFFLPSIKSVIECDGDYWHSRPKDIESDNRKNLALANLGIPLLRIKGSEINNDWDSAMVKVLNFVSQDSVCLAQQ